MDSAARNSRVSQWRQSQNSDSRPPRRTRDSILTDIDNSYSTRDGGTGQRAPRRNEVARPAGYVRASFEPSYPLSPLQEQGETPVMRPYMAPTLQDFPPSSNQRSQDKRYVYLGAGQGPRTSPPAMNEPTPPAGPLPDYREQPMGNYRDQMPYLPPYQSPWPQNYPPYLGQQYPPVPQPFLQPAVPHDPTSEARRIELEVEKYLSKHRTDMDARNRAEVEMAKMKAENDEAQRRLKEEAERLSKKYDSYIRSESLVVSLRAENDQLQRTLKEQAEKFAQKHDRYIQAEASVVTLRAEADQYQRKLKEEAERLAQKHDRCMQSEAIAATLRSEIDLLHRKSKDESERLAQTHEKYMQSEITLITLRAELEAEVKVNATAREKDGKDLQQAQEKIRQLHLHLLRLGEMVEEQRAAREEAESERNFLMDQLENQKPRAKELAEPMSPYPFGGKTGRVEDLGDMEPSAVSLDAASPRPPSSQSDRTVSSLCIPPSVPDPPDQESQTSETRRGEDEVSESRYGDYDERRRSPVGSLRQGTPGRTGKRRHDLRDLLEGLIDPIVLGVSSRLDTRLSEGILIYTPADRHRRRSESHSGQQRPQRSLTASVAPMDAGDLVQGHEADLAKHNSRANTVVQRTHVVLGIPVVPENPNGLSRITGPYEPAPGEGVKLFNDHESSVSTTATRGSESTAKDLEMDGSTLVQSDIGYRPHTSEETPLPNIKRPRSSLFGPRTPLLPRNELLPLAMDALVINRFNR